MVRYRFCLAASVLLLAALATSQVQADLTYRFWGSLSDGTLESFKNDNELADVTEQDDWEVRLVVDTSVVGEIVQSGIYDFVGAVSTAQITLSNTGGNTYQETFDFSSAFLNAGLVTNRLFPGTTHAEPYDEIGFSLARTDEVFMDAYIGTETDQSAITDETVLPSAGAFSQDFVDEFGVFYLYFASGDEIDLFAKNGQFFEVVPEPSSILIWCLAAGLGAVVWRRRRAA